MGRVYIEMLVWARWEAMVSFFELGLLVTCLLFVLF
jgi:hypothetical protein